VGDLFTGGCSPLVRPHRQRSAPLVGKDGGAKEELLAKGYLMSRFSGPQGKGAMREYRAKKRREAYERNALAFASSYPCGHIHSERKASKCPQAVSR
jgi:hypothetical protein